MSSPASHVKLAPTAELERELLMSLDFVPASFRDFWRANPSMMTAHNIRAVIGQQWPSKLAALEAKAMARPSPARPHVAAPQVKRPTASTGTPALSPAAAERAADLAKLDAAFGIGAAPTDSAGVRYERNVLQFGV